MHWFFDAFVLSPGPGLPGSGQVYQSNDQEILATKSIFGVCLGMQAIADGVWWNSFNPARFCMVRWSGFLLLNRLIHYLEVWKPVLVPVFTTAGPLKRKPCRTASALQLWMIVA
ncbi:MAG: hypothetical protein IPN08_10700 [Bacteroidales bacterium]|nr:hypothetical protein [Bacteroidales bacterium]